MRRVVYGVLALCLAGCAETLQGPAADLEVIAAPAPIKEVMPPARPQAPPGPQATGAFFRAWVPASTSPSGETIDGHWETIRATPPPDERVEPEKIMPRASRVPSPPRIQPAKAMPRPVPTLPPGPPAQAPPGLPALPYPLPMMEP